MARKYHQGRFVPRNPAKYKGRINEIFYRSGWELQLFQRMDKNEKVLEWSSEELIIPYLDPVTNRYRRYFPDVRFKHVKPDGTVEEVVAEIKPYKDTVKPVRTKGKRMSTFLNECMTYANNKAKWQAALKYCRANEMRFLLIVKDNKDTDFRYLTEEEIEIT